MSHGVIAGMGVAALILVGSVPGQAGALYNFTSFDGPGNNGGGTTVNGINHGDVVGLSSNSAANPTLFSNFIRNHDGTFSLLNIAGDPLAMANGINDSRAVVGGESNDTAFLMSNVTAAMLASVNGTTPFETAFGINGTGMIVGQYADSATGNTPGFLLNAGILTMLMPTVGALVTNAQGVNNLGVVAGFYSVDGAHQHGFFYNASMQQHTFPADPSVANLFLAQFLGINDHGLAVGYYQTNDGSQHGFLYDTLTHAYTFLDEPLAATTGLSITQITGINDAGEIAGFYVDGATGLQRGFTATAATPEPSAFGLMTAGLLLVLVTQRWRYAS